MFIDRCPDLFAVVLQFLRSCQRPLLDRVDKHALLNECNFFGCEWLAQIIRGEISPYDLRAQDRALRETEREGLADVAAYTLIDVHRAESCVKPRGDLQIPLLALSDIMRTELYGNFTDFYKRLNSFSGGLIDDLVGIGGICIAGGSILSALVKGSAGDIDIYLTVPPADALGVLRQVFNAVQQNQKRSGGKRLLVTRTNNAVTMYRACGISLTAPPVQVILQVYENLAAVLLNFDVDNCCFAFRPGGACVFSSERGLRALRYGVNVRHRAL